MQTTSNYGLKKPEGSDVVDFQIFSDNFDTIDSKMKVIENKAPSAGSTTTPGIVKLNNTVTSNSTSEAATANAVKTAYDKASTAQGTADNAIKRANEAFQSASNGKNAIANAITGKNISASPSESFSTLAAKIGQISIASLGGKRFVQLSVTSSLQKIKFNCPEAYFSEFYYINITGFSFIPSYAVIVQEGRIEKGLYPDITVLNNGNVFFTQDKYWIRHGDSLVISQNNLLLPVYSGGEKYTCILIE